MLRPGAAHELLRDRRGRTGPTPGPVDPAVGLLRRLPCRLGRQVNADLAQRPEPAAHSPGSTTSTRPSRSSARDTVVLGPRPADPDADQRHGRHAGRRRDRRRRRGHHDRRRTAATHRSSCGSGRGKRGPGQDAQGQRPDRPDRPAGRVLPDRRTARRQDHGRPRGQQRPRRARQHLGLARRPRDGRRLGRQPVRHRRGRQRRRRHRHRPLLRALPEGERDLVRRTRADDLLPERVPLRPAEPGRLAARRDPRVRGVQGRRHRQGPRALGRRRYIFTNVDPTHPRDARFRGPGDTGGQAAQPADRLAQPRRAPSTT